VGQDDVLDCFGKPEDIGKIGTDIQAGTSPLDGVTDWVTGHPLARAR
jgi:geranylgeranyl pyrophosphate synthase